MPLPVVMGSEPFLAKKVKHETHCHFLMGFLPCTQPQNNLWQQHQKSDQLHQPQLTYDSPEGEETGLLKVVQEEGGKVMLKWSNICLNITFYANNFKKLMEVLNVGLCGEREVKYVSPDMISTLCLWIFFSYCEVWAVQSLRKYYSSYLGQLDYFCLFPIRNSITTSNLVNSGRDTL